MSLHLMLYNNILKDKYSPVLTVEKILLSICVLLQCPNPYDPLDHEIATMLLYDKANHDKTAREWTRRYATAHRKDLN